MAETGQTDRAQPSQRIRYVPITAERWADALGLLVKGFDQPAAFWTPALSAPAEGEDRGHGLLMEAGGVPVGVMLWFPSRRIVDGVSQAFLNLSSWYVEDAFRPYAPMMLRQATKHRDLVYTDLTPTPSVRQMIELLGFRRVFSGRSVTMPMMNAPRWRPGARVRWLEDDEPEGFPSATRSLLRDHRRLGCRVGLLRRGEDAAAFVVKERRLKRLPAALLIHATDPAVFNRYIENVHAFLLMRLGTMALIQPRRDGGEGPRRGLVLPGSQGYVKGKTVDAALDLAYTELVYLDVDL